MTHATTQRVLGTTRLRVSHRTRFQFAGPLQACRLRAYLKPLETLSQRLVHHQLEILPGPHQRWQRAETPPRWRPCRSRPGGHCWRETEIQIREPAFSGVKLPAAC